MFIVIQFGLRKLRRRKPRGLSPRSCLAVRPVSVWAFTGRVRDRLSSLALDPCLAAIKDELVQRFEYKVVTILAAWTAGYVQKALEEVSIQGWELDRIDERAGGERLYIFKRPPVQKVKPPAKRKLSGI